MVNRRIKWRVFIGSAAVVAVGLAVYIAMTRPSSTANTNSPARQQYAALYQAAYRPDDGSQPTLVTATLLVPQAITWLGQDRGRSTVEDQLWSAVKNLRSNQLAMVLTLDSVADPLADSVISGGLSLTSTGTAWRLDSWTPLIAPSRVVNASSTASSQIGVVVFNADATIDWTGLGALALKVKIPSQSDRQLIWANPALLLNVQ